MIGFQQGVRVADPLEAALGVDLDGDGVVGSKFFPTAGYGR